jgi:hypothetical protein
MAIDQASTANSPMPVMVVTSQHTATSAHPWISSDNTRFPSLGDMRQEGRMITTTMKTTEHIGDNHQWLVLIYLADHKVADAYLMGSGHYRCSSVLLWDNSQAMFRCSNWERWRGDDLS